MGNIFGIRGKNPSTDVPDYGGSGVGGDNYAKNSANCAETTILDSDDFNFIIDNLRRAIRGMGVSDDNINDPSMLLKAIQSANQTKNNPAFPEVLTPNNTLSITDNANGTLTIDAGQEWLWRGLSKLSTDSFSISDRTFSTVADKTYHLRWNATGTGNATPEGTYPNGKFELMDMDGLVEEDRIYDTKFDDMLVALVLTDSGNNPTISLLENKKDLFESGSYVDDAPTDSGQNSAVGSFSFPLAWARTPAIIASPNRAITAGNPTDIDLLVSITESRYTSLITCRWDFCTSIGVAAQLKA